MHEFSICQTLVTAVLQELGRVKGKKIRLIKARVAAGQYHRIVPASLKFAYKILTKGTQAEGSSLLIKTVPIKLKCNKCGWTGTTRDICFVCRKCGGVDLEVIGGKDICLESIEVESAHG